MKFLVQHRLNGWDNDWHTEEKFEYLVDAIEYVLGEAREVERVKYRIKVKGGKVLMKIEALGDYV